MPNQNTILLTMFGMLAVTYLPRVLPVWLFASKSLPPLVIAWLRFVPVAVLAAMLLPSLVIPENRLDLTPGNLFLWAAVPTFLVAWKTRPKIFAPVIAGMLLVAAARLAGF